MCGDQLQHHRAGDSGHCLGSDVLPHLHGHSVTMITDHTAVKTVLETPNPSGKHVQLCSKICGRGIKEVKIIHRAGKANLATDALSCSPQAAKPFEGNGQGEVQRPPSFGVTEGSTSS